MTTAAARLGFADPDDAMAHVLRSTIDYDATGNPVDVETIVAELAASKPYLIAGSTPLPAVPRGGAPSAPSGGGARTMTSADLNALSLSAAGRAQLAAMSEAEFDAAAAR